MIRLLSKFAVSLFTVSLASIFIASTGYFVPSHQLTANHPRKGIQFLDIEHRLMTSPVNFSSKIISFAWSPDGQYLITLQSVDNVKEVQVWDIHTHQWNNLTKQFDIYDLPSWSPDNQRITFTRNRHSGYGSELVVGDISTGKTQLLLKDMPVAYPAWSQDGQRIAFYSRNAELDWELVIVDKDGKVLHQIPFPDNQSLSPQLPPTWVTNQDQVIIQTHKSNNTPDDLDSLYRIDLATESVNPLYTGTAGSGSPLHIHSHDGVSVVVLPLESSRLLITNLVDQTENCLFCLDEPARTSLYLESASWSPDDTFLVIPGSYATSLSIESPTLFIYDRYTNKINLLDAVLIAPLRWRP